MSVKAKEYELELLKHFRQALVPDLQSSVGFVKEVRGILVRYEWTAVMTTTSKVAKRKQARFGPRDKRHVSTSTSRMAMNT